MATTLPPDEVLMEQALAKRIQFLLESIDIPDNIKPRVYHRPRYADTDGEDIAISTIPDPVTPSVPITHIIEVGLPTWTEMPYAGETSTQLNFVYPISYQLQTVDRWDNSNNALVYDNSSDLAMAVAMRARRKIKGDMTLGFENCVHTYLQQVSAVSETDEETGGELHLIDWSLELKITGILV